MPPSKPTYPTSSFNALRSKAKIRNIPFNITKKDIPVPAVCPCCRNGFTKANPASVDRLMPDLGYTKGNVNIICKQCNERKSNALPPHLRNIADWMEKEINRKNRKEPSNASISDASPNDREADIP